MVVLLWLWLGATRPDAYITDRFDLLEVNHYYDENGLPEFVQLIYWDWDSGESRFRCEGYVMMDECLVRTEAGQKRFDAHVNKLIAGKPMQFQTEILSRLRYSGHFVAKGKYPVYDFRKKLWSAKWVKDGVYRRVQATKMRETHTLHDPERDAREFFPVRLRRGLTKVKWP